MIITFGASFNQTATIMELLNLESAVITGYIRVSFFEDSYQFNQEYATIEGGMTFEKVKEIANSFLDKARLYRKGNYWATFEQQQPNGKYVEIVNQRIK